MASVRSEFPNTRLLAGHTVHRRVMLSPSSTGHNSLFLARMADWTWETVSSTCGTELYREKNDNGMATYFSFFYLRLCSGPAMQIHRLTFGDEIDVVTTAFNIGTESMLTLHRISRADADATCPRPVDPLEFYEQRDDACLYVESLNRWITRSRPASNESLVKSSPDGIATRHLPLLPERESRQANVRQRV